MRLIDADKIDFSQVFIGNSDFARDTREAAQDLIDRQPTAYDDDAVCDELENYLFEKYCIEGDSKIDEIVINGGKKQ